MFFLTTAFLNGNPNFIAGPNSIVTGNHTAHMTVDLGVLISYRKPQFYRGGMEAYPFIIHLQRSRPYQGNIMQHL